MKSFIIIPENEYGIEPGVYSRNEYVSLLRHNASNREVIIYLADMLEE